MLEDNNATTRNLEPGTWNQLPASCFPLKPVNQCHSFLVLELKWKNIETFQVFVVPFVLVGEVNQFGGKNANSGTH